MENPSLRVERGNTKAHFGTHFPAKKKIWAAFVARTTDHTHTLGWIASATTRQASRLAMTP